jgi:anti-sigma B factor antagonist
MSNLTIQTESHKRVDVITVSGRVDSSNVHELDSTFNSFAEEGRYNYVVDLSEVAYISSAGLRALNTALRNGKRNGGNLVLVSPSENVIDVLSLSGLDAVFNSFDDMVDAVGSF